MAHMITPAPDSLSASAAGEHPKPIVFGCVGPVLSAAEGDFFGAMQPVGFILFARNCKTPRQTRALIKTLRDCIQHPDPPILIDQEGGRVARLGPPHWRGPPAAGLFADLAKDDRAAACRAARMNARLIAADLNDLGITVNCAPVLDVPVPGAHDIIGDRAFGSDPKIVSALGEAVCAGFADSGVQPVLKHIPGHGRARCDSHHALPVVEASERSLRATDFVPFARLGTAPWAMTAHVVYRALDSRPATLSPRVISDVVRGEIGFDGVLISDDISMRALSGAVGDRAAAALAAGCDLVLHCNGDSSEMAAVAAATGSLGDGCRRRLEAAGPPPRPKPLDRVATRRQLTNLLSGLSVSA